MQTWFYVKVRGIMGDGPGDISEIKLLGRTIRWTSEGLQFEADGRHREMIMNDHGLNEESKPLTLPVVVSNSFEEEDESPQLPAEEARSFRGTAARLNFLGPDRPDVQFASKTVSRTMAKPSEFGQKQLKKTGPVDSLWISQ